MALIANTVLNIPGSTQIISFSNPSLIDEIDFGNNQITFKAISSYNLSQSDFNLYVNYLIIYYNALLTNFTNLGKYFNIKLPICLYDFKVGSTRITFDYQSGTTDTYNSTYLFSNSTMTIAARPSDVVVSIQ